MTPLPRNIVLIGPMGAGKTTIGKQLARDLGFAFVDSDHVIEARCGCDIPWIFDVEGEAGFRQRETAVIADISLGAAQVIATGGGAILSQANREALQAAGLVVYLHTSIAQQLERTYKDKNRPLLQNNNPRKILEDMYAVRDPLYRSIADLVVTTDQRHPRHVIKQIMMHTRQRDAVDSN